MFTHYHIVILLENSTLPFSTVSKNGVSKRTRRMHSQDKCYSTRDIFSHVDKYQSLSAYLISFIQRVIVVKIQLQHHWITGYSYTFKLIWSVFLKFSFISYLFKGPSPNYRLNAAHNDPGPREPVSARFALPRAPTGSPGNGHLH